MTTSRTLRAACLALVSGCFAAAAAAVPVDRPNILWLVAEDIGPEVLGRSGTPETLTPVLDQLARDGVNYTRAYSTSPVCSPSRSAFMTGMYAITIGAHHHRTAPKKPLPEGVLPLTARLRDKGYFTANVVNLPPVAGQKGAGKTDWNFKFEGPAFDGNAWGELKGRQPFYAQVNFNETHRTFRGPKAADPAKVVLPPYYPDHPVARQDWADYLDAGRELDRKVGRILGLLEAEGLADNTIVVFMGDNGQAHVRGKQFLYEEGLHVPLIVRWPKGMKAPEGFLPGKDDPRLIELIDLAATTLSWAGIKKPPAMEGRVFLGPDAGKPREMVFAARDRMDETVMRHRGVRDDRYRYIRNFTPEQPFFSKNLYKEQQYPMWNLIQELNREGKLTPAQAVLCQPRMPEEELYDLAADPHEIHNLAASGQPAHQAALKKLRAAVDQWIRRTGDLGVVKERKAPARRPK